MSFFGEIMIHYLILIDWIFCELKLIDRLIDDDFLILIDWIFCELKLIDRLIDGLFPLVGCIPIGWLYPHWLCFTTSWCFRQWPLSFCSDSFSICEGVHRVRLQWWELFKLRFGVHFFFPALDLPISLGNQIDNSWHTGSHPIENMRKIL